MFEVLLFVLIVCCSIICQFSLDKPSGEIFALIVFVTFKLCLTCYQNLWIAGSLIVHNSFNTSNKDKQSHTHDLWYNFFFFFVNDSQHILIKNSHFIFLLLIIKDIIPNTKVYLYGKLSLIRLFYIWVAIRTSRIRLVYSKNSIPTLRNFPLISSRKT